MPQVLAGQTKGLQGMRFSGSLHYNGHTPDEFQARMMAQSAAPLISRCALLTWHARSKQHAVTPSACPARSRCSAPRPLWRRRTATSPR
jgi:hypothetical protein